MGHFSVDRHSEQRELYDKIRIIQNTFYKSLARENLGDYTH